MYKSESNQHLSQIETNWMMLFRAHRGPPDEAAAARAALMLRYGGAIHRYLLWVTGDADTADELVQTFALRFLRGDFRNVTPSLGRFRDFIKRAAHNLVVDYIRRRRVQPRPLGEVQDMPELVSPAPDLSDFDRQFLDSWREEVITCAWEGLARHQERTRQPYYTVLRFRVDHPDLHSPSMAEQLSASLGRPVTAVWVRQVLLHARQRFVDLLVEEVAGSLENPTPERVEQELIDLDLLGYCRPGLDRYGCHP